VFGPRTKDNGQRNIHKGIDYGRPSQAEPIEGKLIQAIEGGSITLIDDTVAGVYYMQITCSVPACHGRVFSYNHLFNNNILTGTLTPITGSNPNNYAKVTLEAIDDPVDPETFYYLVVIFWKDDNTIAKALAEKAGLPVHPEKFCAVNGGTVQGPCQTRRTVDAHEEIALVGNSGPAGTAPHLHVQANANKTNPLFYLNDPPIS